MEIWGSGVIQDARLISHIAYLSENIVRGQYWAHVGPRIKGSEPKAATHLIRDVWEI